MSLRAEDFKSGVGIVVKPSGGETCCPSGNLLPTACPPTLVEADSDLATVIDAWDRLPGAVRAGLVAMVKATLLER